MHTMKPMAPVLRSRMGSATSASGLGNRAQRDATDHELLRRYRSDRSPATRAGVVEAFMPLARSLARRYQRGEEPLDDLEQVAAVGLLKALEGFDIERGTAFASFAVPTIVGELRRHFRDKGWAIRVPRELQELSLKVQRESEAAALDLGRPPTVHELARRLGTSAEQVLEAREALYAMRPVSLDRPALSDDQSDGDTLIDRFGTTEAGFARAEDAVVIGRLLHRLPERERRAVELRFHEDLTQSEIGERLGFSQMHVSRLLRRALAELQAMGAADGDGASPADAA